MDQQGSVFLPQVPVEQGWDLTTYLEQLCFKAGLPKDAWKDTDARLFIFSVDIIKQARTSTNILDKRQK